MAVRWLITIAMVFGVFGGGVLWADEVDPLDPLDPHHVEASDPDDEYIMSEEEAAFLEWANSIVDAFWNNGLLDFIPFLNPDDVPTDMPYGDPPNETTGGGTYIPLLPYNPEFECGFSHLVDVHSTMYIKPFDRKPSYKKFLADNFLFPMNHSVGSRLAFLEICNMTNGLGDTGSPVEPAAWTQRKFRAAADLEMTVTVQDGLFTDLYYEFGVRGGPEPTPLGALHGKVKGKITKVDATPQKITIEYVLYGRPNEAAEIPFGVACAGLRTSRWIWHYVRVELLPVWCDDYTASATFITDSLFPSDDLFLNGALVDHRAQSDITDLWLHLCGTHAPGLPGFKNYVGSSGVCSGGGTPPLPNNPETAPADASSQ